VLILRRITVLIQLMVLCAHRDKGENMVCCCHNYYYGVLEFKLVRFSTQKYQDMCLPYDKGDDILRKNAGFIYPIFCLLYSYDQTNFRRLIVQ
jgi:hypothetical protein